MEPPVTCARCGFALPADAWRCPSCAAPAGEAPRSPVDCIAAVYRPTLPPGETGEPVALLGSIVVGALVAFALLSLTEAVAGLKAVDAISDGDLDASSVDSLRWTLYVLETLVGVVLTVSFFLWLRRVVRNAVKFGVKRQRTNSAWTVGFWFVPVLNLWRPKQIMNDAWDGSGGRSRSLVDWWWGTLLLAQYVTYSAAYVFGGASDGGQLRNALKYGVFCALLGSAAFVLAGLLVHRLTRMQQAALDSS